MKPQQLFAVVVSLFVYGGTPPELRGQGTFQNLNFESAVIVPILGDPAGRVEYGPAFPGWTAYINAFPLPSTAPATYNNPYIGSAGFGLENSATVFGRFISNQTALIQTSVMPGSPSVSFAQTGLIPVGTLSLRFHAIVFGPNFSVNLNGQPVSLGVLQDFGSYREYGADISGLAGQTAELRFTKPPASGDLYFDNISFSTVAVPEPGTWALLGLGGALLWSATRRRRK